MICAIVLAAGQSRRMGTQKLLLPLAGQTVIGHVVDQVLASEVERAFAVVSNRDDGVATALAARQISIVANPDAQGDMLSSVRAGLRALPQECAAVIIVLGDQPSLRPQIINQLIHRLQAVSRGIAVPVYDGKRGHPLAFSRCYFAEVLTRYDGIGLRGLLDGHPDDVHEMAVTDSGVLEDMDHPADYRRERLKFL